jgi:hypothetical protein
METANIKTPPMYKAQGDMFLADYECEREIYCPDQKMPSLTIKSLRVCRFCNKKFGEVSFKKEAHIFPVALGNKYLVSDFECDSCNHIFGTYEDDLCKYLGIERTLSKTEGRKDIPGFVSSNIRATKQPILGQLDAIKIEPNNGGEIFGFNPETNTRTITYKKPAYVPVNVYKALLKMALCCVAKGDLKYYQKAFKFLTSSDLDGKIKACYLFGYRLPINYTDMFGVLYRKRYDSLKTMTHTFILYYGSFMLQIFLPFYQKDLKHYTDLHLPIMPPLFDGTGDEKWVASYAIKDDLSSPEKRIGEEEVLHMKISEEDLKNMVAIDPFTKKVVERKSSPPNVAGIFIVDKDFKFKLD